MGAVCKQKPHGQDHHSQKGQLSESRYRRKNHHASDAYVHGHAGVPVTTRLSAIAD